MNLELIMNYINKIIAKAQMWRNNKFFLRKHVSMKLLEVSLSCLHFSLMFSVGEIKSPCFCKCAEPWIQAQFWSFFLSVHITGLVSLVLKTLNNYQLQICLPTFGNGKYLLSIVHVFIHKNGIWMFLRQMAL